MAEQIREYSGWLGTSLTVSSQEKIRMMATVYGLEVDVASGYVEFEFHGRDSNRFVVAFLRDLARLVVDADGEVRCETKSEGSDPCFEFFSINDGKLLRQTAKLVRDPPEVIGSEV